MRVIGFSFNQISIEKKKELDRNIKINTNIDIKDISFPKLDLFQTKEVANFEYNFKIFYEDCAELIFKGTILVLIEDKKQFEELKKSWKTKKIDDKLRIPLMNIILSKCNLKALQLEEDLGLPAHLPAPRITSSEKN